MSIYGKMACDGCKFWGRERAHDDDMPLGTCHALPPSLGKTQVLAYHDPDRPSAPGPLVQRGAWPWTAIDDWCASFTDANATEHL